MKNSLTYSEAISRAIATLIAYSDEQEDTEDTVATLYALRDSIDKRNSRASEHKTPTKTQVANEGFKAEILVFLSDGKHVTVSDIIKGVASLNGETTQKVSALMRLLKLEGKVDKEVVKGKTLFFLI